MDQYLEFNRQHLSNIQISVVTDKKRKCTGCRLTGLPGDAKPIDLFDLNDDERAKQANIPVSASASIYVVYERFE